ncbi:MAG: TIGR00730 family Rossman fold protein [Tannerella sp.]|jgi:uncharacterized protein (TIGR00730 family)|nr:TIGR00730 family Rossman fold protein [Tannerella sp.]
MIQSVCIYCASSTQISPVYSLAAAQLGTLLGKRNIKIINGAGSIGLMRMVADAALQAGGTVTGVIPRFMVKNGWGHTALTEMIEVETMHERKQVMVDLSDAAIALPGGYGTMEELLEIITWKQLGLYQKPIVIMNTNGYYDALFSMLQHAVNEYFIHPQHALIWKVAKTPEQAVDLLFEQDSFVYMPKIGYHTL